MYVIHVHIYTHTHIYTHRYKYIYVQDFNKRILWYCSGRYERKKTANKHMQVYELYTNIYLMGVSVHLRVYVNIHCIVAIYIYIN